MQLAITFLAEHQVNFLPDLLAILHDCKCALLELRATQLKQSTAAYVLIQGNWNQIAKVETTLESMQKRSDIKIHSFRPNTSDGKKDSLPYSLETISLERGNVLGSLTAFLQERHIAIEEVSASSYQTSYTPTSVFTTKFIVLIPPEIRLLSLREEFLDFCDQLNIDAVLEPIKR